VSGSLRASARMGKASKGAMLINASQDAVLIS
jgi:hypothetical protein